MKTNAANGSRPWLRASAMALVALGLASLAGCTGGSTPIVTETPSPTATANSTPSPSPSPSPTPLTDAELLALMPPEAAYPDVRGAIATAQFFTQQFAVMFQTGDSRVLAALSLPECTFCSDVLVDAARERAAGDRETGGDLVADVSDVRANVSQTDGYTYVDFPYIQSAVTLHHADGSADPPQSGRSGRIFFRMALDGAVWNVRGAEVQN